VSPQSLVLLHPLLLIISGLGLSPDLLGFGIRQFRIWFGGTQSSGGSELVFHHFLRADVAFEAWIEI